jgi:dienelactone hydrolase
MCSGPFKAMALNPIKVRVGTNEEGEAVIATLHVRVPTGSPAGENGGKRPMALVSTGFLVESTSYASYCEQLASWGCVAVRYDLSEFRDDMTTVTAMRVIMDACEKDPQVGAYLDSTRAFLIGHSRGAKLSALCAAADKRVAGAHAQVHA